MADDTSRDFQGLEYAEGIATKDATLRLAARVVTAYVGRNSVSVPDIPDLIHTVFVALSDAGSQAAAPAEPQRPAVPVKKSVTPDYIICLEDGKKLKMLKRHLRTTYEMTPEEYRAKWGLPADYPMVAPNYAQQRSDFARKIGLGRRSAPVAPPASAAAKRGRRKAGA